MLNENGYTSGYFSLSVALHGLAVLGIILMPQLELLDEGSGHAIEFVAMEEPKGEQLDTPVVAEKEVVVEKPVKKPKKAPAAKKEVKTAEAPLPSLEDLKPKNDPPPMPENLDSEISDEEPPKPEVATVLPDKEEVSLPEPTPEQPVEDTKVDDFLAEESDAITEEAQTAALAIATVEDTPVVEEPVAKPEEPIAAAEENPVEEEKPVATVAPLEDPFAEEEKEALAAANIPVEEKPMAAGEGTATEKPQVAPSQPSTTEAGSTRQAPAVAQNASNKAYGKPTGQVRSYLDLSQVQGNRPPRYPTLARRLNQQGQVKLAYFVKSDGTIGQMKLVKSSGSQLLDKEAIRAVSKYRYKPGQAGWTLHPVNFTLQGPTKKMPSRLRTSRRGGS